MENSKLSSQSKQPDKNVHDVVVLRWGHRPQRDVRLTTHVALAARALGAKGFVLSDVSDQKIKDTVESVKEGWGGDFWFEMGTSWKRRVKEWRKNEGIVVHLTVYGENIQDSDVLERIKECEKDVLVVVGSQKVPRDFYWEDVSDFNVAVGNQPHSECAALAVFLDRFFEGKPLSKTFENAKMSIIPQKRGKKIV